MIHLMSITLAMFVSFSPPAPPDTEIPFDTIASCSVVEDRAFIALHDGSTFFVNKDLVTVGTFGVTIQWGSFDDDADRGDGGHHLLTVEYRDKENRLHRIQTDCRRYATRRACIHAHAQAVEEYETVFPR